MPFPRARTAPALAALLAAGSLVAAGPLPAPAQAALTVPVRCESVPDDEVVLAWDDVAYDVSGTCGVVRVTADRATVTMSTATRLVVEGTGNRVSSKSVLALEVTGDDNAVSTPSVRTLLLAGSGSAVTVAGLLEDARLTGLGVSLRADRVHALVLRGAAADVAVADVLEVRVPGSDHAVRLTRAEKVVVRGDRNRVQVDRGRTRVRVHGEDNRVRVHRRR